jgi:hypothetical protein
VIYLDTSVAMAHLLVEDRCPPDSLWSQPLVASRLLEYELFTRISGRGLADSHGAVVGQLLSRIAFLELIDDVILRMRTPFPTQVRTLDALHLASMHFLREQRVTVSLASYDTRLVAAAKAMDFPIHALP